MLDQPQSLRSLILAATQGIAQEIAKVIALLGTVVHVRWTFLPGEFDVEVQATALEQKSRTEVATPGRLQRGSFRQIQAIFSDRLC